MRRIFVYSFFVMLFLAVTAMNVLADINQDLYSAVNRGDTQAVKNLLQNGANPNARCKNWAGKQDFTPVYAAAESGSAEILGLLIDKGGDVNVHCPMGMTPLMTAANKGKKDAVALLLEKGADANAKDTDGVTVLLYAVESFEAPEDAANAIVKALLDKGADPNMLKDGWSPLMYAAARNKPQIVKLLIAKGANVNANKDGNTALKFAVDREYLEIEKALRAAGAK
ncbi:MAG TPA: ankyrin repeat domain-containing protein [Smithella sp.]|nr:ankyrin repeat domain-containing protein [Smithella sp.]